jgi:anti-sigma regulatory factor (Ser/Thr protein kinase)
MSAGRPDRTWRFTISLSTAPEELRIARRLVVAAAREAGADAVTLLDLEVAVGEGVANAHIHAYGGGRAGKIHLDLRFDGAALSVAIRDTGQPVAGVPEIPTSLPPPGRGRGLYLIGRLMDEARLVHPDRRGRGTMLFMRKHLR